MNKFETESVKGYWNEESCGERYASGEDQMAFYISETEKRYGLEPYILSFAEFDNFKGLDVLEVGVGMGSDHSMIARSQPKSLTGVDLTERAIEHTAARFEALGLDSTLHTDNAQKLSFNDESFDAVYSWGVLHHSPNTDTCINEVWRVLRPGGFTKIMIYHKQSPTGWMLWLRYGLLKMKPFMSLKEVYSKYLESPGTKAYTVAETHALFSKYSEVETEVILCFGDLLLGDVGQRHHGPILTIAKALYPRTLVRLLAKMFPIGLFLVITAKK